ELPLFPYTTLFRSRDRGHVGDGGRGEPARERRIDSRCHPQLGVVCVGGQLQRRRHLLRQLESRAGPAAERDRGHVGDGGRGEPARKRGIEPVCLTHLGVVCLGGQLQRRRHL